VSRDDLLGIEIVNAHVGDANLHRPLCIQREATQVTSRAGAAKSRLKLLPPLGEPFSHGT